MHIQQSVWKIINYKILTLLSVPADDGPYTKFSKRSSLSSMHFNAESSIIINLLVTEPEFEYTSCLQNQTDQKTTKNKYFVDLTYV